MRFSALPVVTSSGPPGPERHPSFHWEGSQRWTLAQTPEPWILGDGGVHLLKESRERETPDATSEAEMFALLDY